MEEKRQNPRFQKQYTIMFALKDQPQKQFDLSNLRDIGKGGLRYLSYEPHPIGTRINYFIKFPFLYPNVIGIEGKVVGVEDIMKGKTYFLRIQFVDLTPQAISALDEMEKINKKMSR